MSKPTRRSSARVDTRAEQSVPVLEDVASLLQQRRKYADWIAALDAKRGQTPKHVFTRVHADYEARLQEVLEKLAQHKGSLAAEQTELRNHLDSIDLEIQQHHDRRDETELRAHVGELSEPALAEALRSADSELERLAVERAVVVADLARIDDFVAATESGGTGSTKPERSSSFDELSFLHSVVGDEAERRERTALAKGGSPTPGSKAGRASAGEDSSPARPQSSAEATKATSGEREEKSDKPEKSDVATKSERRDKSDKNDADAAIDQDDDSTSAPVSAKPGKVETGEKDARRAKEDGQPGTAAPTVGATATEDAEKRAVDAEAPKERAAPVDPDAGYGTKSPPSRLPRSLDAEIPLPKPGEPRKSIVMEMSEMTIEPKEARASGIIKAPDTAPSLLDGLESSAEKGGKPFGGNIRTEVTLSPKSSLRDVKTLKCRECGAMNDPSEWYCERCGAELSAI